MRVVHNTYNAAGVATNNVNRYIAYSNDETGALAGKPQVAAYTAMSWQVIPMVKT